MEGGPPTFRQDYTCPALLKDLAYLLPVRGYHPLWPLFPKRSGSHLQTTGLIRFRSPLLTESLLMSFPPGTEMFQFPGFASLAGYTLRCGFPHSDIHGSTGARPSPQLFAACHVLHRLLAPRHPPNALTSTLDCFNSLHFTHAQRRHQTMSISQIHSLDKSVCIRPVQIHMSQSHSGSASPEHWRYLPNAMTHHTKPSFQGQTQ